MPFFCEEWRPLGPEDRPTIEQLLGARPALAMFPLSNLRAHGFDRDHPNGTRYWAAPDKSAILGVTNAGMVLPVWSGSDAARPAAAMLRGMRVTGVAGPAPVVRPLLDALGLAQTQTLHDADEPQFVLSLKDLIVPPGPGALVPLADYAELAADWRRASDTELGMGTTAKAAEAAVARWIDADSHRILVIDGTPVCLTGFNARLPQIVQVGGVYTPPALRNRGHARRAVALHLAEARDTGVAEATLFAVSAAAVACYAPLGFRQIGQFAVVLFETDVTP